MQTSTLITIAMIGVALTAAALVGWIQGYVLQRAYQKEIERLRADNSNLLGRVAELVMALPAALSPWLVASRQPLTRHPPPEDPETRVTRLLQEQADENMRQYFRKEGLSETEVEESLKEAKKELSGW